MDAPRFAHPGPLLISAIAVLLLVLCAQALPAQAPGASAEEQARQWAAQQMWQQIVDLVRGLPKPSADLDFYYGTALARLGKVEEARRALLAGSRLSPKDARFSVELGGIAFRQRHFVRAAAYLRQGLKLAPHDAYAENFLGTVYFLQGNLKAALKYWNRDDKPHVVRVVERPAPDVDPQLLDSALTFSPESTLRLPDLMTSEARVGALGVFPNYEFNLQIRPDGKFDVIFYNEAQQTWGKKKWLTLALMLRGLPAETVYPEYYNIHHKAINFTSLYRWDAQKRRITANLSSPFDRAKRNFNVGLDLRDENWRIVDSFTGPAPLRGALNLRREAVSANFLSIVNGRWQWSAGGEISHRDFRDVDPGVALTPELLLKGYQLKQTSSLDAEIWQMPEHRMDLRGGGAAALGRLWSQPPHSFAKLQAWEKFHWFPEPAGDDYEMQQQIHAGKTFGDLPFDELFALGIGGDTNLMMRGHVATRNGRKGSAPLGRNFFLSNWEVDKNVYHYGPATIKVGPFFDTGTITDPDPGLGSRKWLWDTGLQLKARMLGAEVIVSLGKDLRSGNNAVYVTLTSVSWQ